MPPSPLPPPPPPPNHAIHVQWVVVGTQYNRCFPLQTVHGSVARPLPLLTCSFSQTFSSFPFFFFFFFFFFFVSSFTGLSLSHLPPSCFSSSPVFPFSGHLLSYLFLLISFSRFFFLLFLFSCIPFARLHTVFLLLLFLPFLSSYVFPFSGLPPTSLSPFPFSPVFSFPDLPLTNCLSFLLLSVLFPPVLISCFVYLPWSYPRPLV